ncbi:MAG: hypothetical protein QG641_2713 [Candidatus Poribacteria bacterium]|nr:hypothetical protein [Candidatus Poribacteria bacterium]
MVSHPQAPTSKLLELIKSSKPTNDETEDTQKTVNITTKKRKETKLKSAQNKEEQGIEKRDDISISSNYYKVPNIIDDQIVGTLSTTEEIVYRHIIRLSWGWNRNWCKVGTHYFQEKSSIKSRKAVRDAINRLLEKQLIKYNTVNGKVDRDQDGTVYIVPLPEVSSILPNSILPGSIPDKALQNGQKPEGILQDSILDNSIPPNSILRNNTLGILGNSILQNSIPDSNQDTVTKNEGVLFGSILPNDPIKYIYKDSIKNTLSQDQIIDLFYKGIGQTKISQRKRERAKKCFEELIQDGFSQEDIVFAINWTIKNAKEKPYDFALIKDTIGQAMAAEKEIEAEEQKSLEKEQNRTRQLEEEKKLVEERERITTYKESLSPKQRSELRERALHEIRKTKGIKEEFITEIFIESKENEIIRKQLGIKINGDI